VFDDVHKSGILFVRTDTGHREMQNNINGWEVNAEEQQHKVTREYSLCEGKNKLNERICHQRHTEKWRKLQRVANNYEINCSM
jgi:hypothetical protein